MPKETLAVYENGEPLASNGAALGEKGLAEARRIAANIAKLPNLFREEDWPLFHLFVQRPPGHSIDDRKAVVCHARGGFRRKPTPNVKINQPLVPGGAKCAEVPRIREASFDSPVPISRRKQSAPACVASVALRNERDTIALRSAEMVTNLMRG